MNLTLNRVESGCFWLKNHIVLAGQLLQQVLFGLGDLLFIFLEVSFQLGDLGHALLFGFGGFALAPLSIGGIAIGLIPWGGAAVGLFAAGGFAFGDDSPEQCVRDPFSNWNPAPSFF